MKKTSKLQNRELKIKKTTNYPIKTFMKISKIINLRPRIFSHFTKIGRKRVIISEQIQKSSNWPKNIFLTLNINELHLPSTSLSKTSKNSKIKILKQVKKYMTDLFWDFEKIIPSRKKRVSFEPNI